MTSSQPPPSMTSSQPPSFYDVIPTPSLRVKPRFRFLIFIVNGITSGPNLTVHNYLQAPTMAYFDTAKRSLLIVDGSRLGICAIFAQQDKSTELYRIISYASRALSPIDSRYSQTDIEGLSLFWGNEHFHLFLLGTEFDVYTDHKALEAIFNNPKSKPPARIERWMLRLQPYNFRVIYRKGTFNEEGYKQSRSQPDNLVPLCKFRIIVIIHFFRN